MIPLRGTCMAVAVVFVPIAASAQSTAAEAPRTPWGDPALGGIWDYRTITPLERPTDLGDKAFLTEKEAAAKEREAEERERAMNEKPAERTEVGGSVGAYNWFWLDFGTQVVETRRTSLVVHPNNGRRPPMTPEARAARSGKPPWGQEPPPDTYQDLNPFDRCTGTMALPIFPIAYNNNVQIFQTPDHIALWVEMMASTRIIPLDGRPHGTIRQPLGDSRGYWEGDTLVIETDNFNDHTKQRRWRGASQNMRLVERLTRIDEGTLEYRFTVMDPETWTESWTASIPMRRTDVPMYEYACHEGNYGLINILAGARADELNSAGP